MSQPQIIASGGAIWGSGARGDPGRKLASLISDLDKCRAVDHGLRAAPVGDSHDPNARTLECHQHRLGRLANC